MLDVLFFVIWLKIVFIGAHLMFQKLSCIKCHSKLPITPGMMVRAVSGRGMPMAMGRRGRWPSELPEIVPLFGKTSD